MFRSKRQIPVENQNVSAVPIPLFHAFAGVLCVYGLSACGLTMALTNLRYTAQSFVEGAIKVGATEAWLVPTMVVDVLNYCQTNNLTIPGLKSENESVTRTGFTNCFSCSSNCGRRRVSARCCEAGFQNIPVARTNHYCVRLHRDW